MPLLILFFVQCVLALGVVLFLKKALNRELVEAALENLEGCPASNDVQEIIVRFYSGAGERIKSHLESIRRRKFVRAHLDIKEDRGLKGGMVIAVGETLLDFSLASRWRQLWS